MDKITTIGMSADGKGIEILYGFKGEAGAGQGVSQIAYFRIEEVWDMIRDNVATIDAGPSSPGLLRRKGEAISALSYTQERIINALR
jgi:hypothetical protein